MFYLQNAPQGIVNTNVSFLEKMRGSEVFVAYLKPMSSEASGKLDFYEEMEWRIVASRLPECEVFNKTEGHCTLDFDPTKVALLVFPDAITRRLATSDVNMMELFAGSLPMMVDAPDIEHL